MIDDSRESMIRYDGSVFRVAVILFLLLILPTTIKARSLSGPVEEVIDSLMIRGLRMGYYPGASIEIGTHNEVLFSRTYGFQDNTKRRVVGADDVYDLASVTKVIATTLIVMELYDQKRISLNGVVSDYVSNYNNSDVGDLTISQLLTHTSGLPYFPAYTLMFENPTGQTLIATRQSEDYPKRVDRASYLYKNPAVIDSLVSFEPIRGYRRAGESVYINPQIDSVLRQQIIDSYNSKLKGRYRYSDTNFYILRQIVEQITSRTIDELTAVLFERLEMYNTGYRPLDWKSPNTIIPTEDDLLLQRGLLVGYVHDDLAATNGGVGGNAGLFSNVSDLGNYCRMMLSKGVYNRDRIVEKSSIELFTSSLLSPKKIYRGLGFDKRKPGSDLGNGYGHTGYTGTMIWIDPESDIYFVFLSNRVNPTRLNRGLSASEMRTDIWKLITKRGRN